MRLHTCAPIHLEVHFFCIELHRSLPLAMSISQIRYLVSIYIYWMRLDPQVLLLYRMHDIHQMPQSAGVFLLSRRLYVMSQFISSLISFITQTVTEEC